MWCLRSAFGSASLTRLGRCCRVLAFVFPTRIGQRRRDHSDVIVAFEVLSPSTEGRDLSWKRKAYTSLSSLTHYIAISQDVVDVVVFARDEDFAEKRIRSIDKVIELRSLGISLPVAEIYRDTGLA